MSRPTALRLGFVTVEDGGEVLADMTGLLASALASQGTRALDMPKRAAAWHEAGHAVVGAVEGEPVHSVRIKRRKHSDGRVGWTGRIEGGTAWRVDGLTDPPQIFGEPESSWPALSPR